MKCVYKVLPICLIVLGLVCPGCGPSSTAQLEENKALVRRAEEAAEKGNWTIFKDLHAPDYVFHGPGGAKPLTFEEIVQSFRAFCDAFPDFRTTIHDLIAEGDKVVSRLTRRGTHKGEYRGIPATGKEVTITEILIFRIAGGKITEMWAEEDELGFMRQLGVIPAAE